MTSCGIFELLFTNRLDPSVLVSAGAALAGFVASKTKAELFAAARERRLLIAPVATIKDVAAFEQFAAREYWDYVSIPVAGAPRLVTFPGRWAQASATPLRQLGAAPTLGEHEAELDALLERGPVRQEATASGVSPKRCLADLKVLDFSWVVAGPAATRTLADHGATVVRIETESLG